jgi:hypothetical protein
MRRVEHARMALRSDGMRRTKTAAVRQQYTTADWLVSYKLDSFFEFLLHVDGRLQSVPDIRKEPLCAVRAGEPERRIMRQTGTSRVEMVLRYVRTANAFSDNTAVALGL